MTLREIKETADKKFGVNNPDIGKSDYRLGWESGALFVAEHVNENVKALEKKIRELEKALSEMHNLDKFNY